MHIFHKWSKWSKVVTKTEDKYVRLFDFRQCEVCRRTQCEVVLAGEIIWPAKLPAIQEESAQNALDAVKALKNGSVK